MNGTTTRCEEVRDALSASGAPTPTIDRHLGACAECRRWAETLLRLRAVAPETVPSPPADLTDRVRRTVAPPATATAISSAGAGTDARRRRWQRPVLAGGLAAAVVALLAVAAVSTLGPGTDDDPVLADDAEEVIVAAARTVRAGDAGYRFDLEGGVEASFPVPEPAAAELSDLDGFLDELGPDELVLDPEELCDRFTGEARLHCEEAVDSLPGDAGADRVLDALRTEMRDELARLRDELGRLTGRTPPFDGPDGRFSVTFSGEGVGVGERTRAEIDYRFDAPVAHNGRLEVVTVEDDTYVRTERTESWVRMPAHYRGFHVGDLRAPEQLDTILEHLEDPTAPVSALGPRTVDGVRTEGFRLETPGDITIEVWIDTDRDLIRELTWRSEVPTTGAEGEVAASTWTTMRFSDHGADVAVEPPAEWIPLDEVPHDRRPPFTVGVRIDLSGDEG